MFSTGTIFTIVLLMRALDALKYKDETGNYLSKLCEVDPYRQGYYKDLQMKYSLENAIEKYLTEQSNVS